jgi:hypothetical protein
LSSSGYFQVRLLLRWSLVSLLLQGKTKTATGNSVPSSQTAAKLSNEWKSPQQNDEKVICLPAAVEDLRIVHVVYGNLWPG